ncbi:hypothetical protein [Sulfurospirillum multivorans]|nr:hypothetical protein [Sulfurospirillum multivorans]QEH06472.1 hypothetical protein SMN_1707 [Sulfurospirillum multivorans]
MSKNNIRTTILICLIPLLISGCSRKNDAPKKTEPTIEYKVVMQEREEKKVYDPVMRDNSPTQRAVIDMGVVLKTRITSYKDNNHVLNEEHNVFFFAVQPDFVVTNSLPKEKSKYSYQGPIVDFSESKFIDPEQKVNTESRVLEREAEFDKKIDSFLNTQNGK